MLFGFTQVQSSAMPARISLGGDLARTRLEDRVCGQPQAPLRTPTASQSERGLGEGGTGEANVAAGALTAPLVWVAVSGVFCQSNLPILTTKRAIRCVFHVRIFLKKSNKVTKVKRSFGGVLYTHCLVLRESQCVVK